jgi:hypothetical protein
MKAEFRWVTGLFENDPVVLKLARLPDRCGSEELGLYMGLDMDERPPFCRGRSLPSFS